MGDSTFVGHEPCPACGSSDALGRYDDGHASCFSEGCGYYEPASGESGGVTSTSTAGGFEPLRGESRALKRRRIDQKTCERWRYESGLHHGKPVQIANYIVDGQVVAQKLRYADKSFAIKGKAKQMGLYGQWLWSKGGKMVVVTEGEIDALTVSQMQDNRWPVVSLPNGAGSAVKTFKQHLDWLESFDRVVLMFDQDEPGREAAQKAAAVLSPGKARIAKLPLKDPNEMLQAGRGKEIINAIWQAEEWRPDGIVSAKDLIEEAVKPVEWGLSWPWEPLTLHTYGIRRKEVYALGAGTGIGKTDLFTQIAAHLMLEHNLPVGLLYLEQPPVETLRRVAGKVMGKRFHIPDAEWTEEELRRGIEMVSDKLTLYDHFGSTDWETIQGRIRYMVQSLGIRDIFLDHLTALAAHAEDERKALEAIMADIAQLAQELDITFYFISHLTTPEGKPHEEGGRIFIRHFKGSRAIGFWSHFMFAMERDQQASREERSTTTFRVLKDRYTGQSTGETFFLGYDYQTGLLHVTDGPGGDEPDFDDNEEF